MKRRKDRKNKENEGKFMKWNGRKKDGNKCWEIGS
jgi:hypothetical protein